MLRNYVEVIYMTMNSAYLAFELQKEGAEKRSNAWIKLSMLLRLNGPSITTMVATSSAEVRTERWNKKRNKNVSRNIVNIYSTPVIPTSFKCLFMQMYLAYSEFSSE